MLLAVAAVAKRNNNNGEVKLNGGPVSTFSTASINIQVISGRVDVSGGNLAEGQAALRLSFGSSRSRAPLDTPASYNPQDFHSIKPHFSLGLWCNEQMYQRAVNSFSSSR